MQFILWLSSTSINNKHLCETGPSLGGWRRHRPARSTSDEALCALGLCRARHLLSTRLVFRCWEPPGTIFTHAFSHLSKPQLYQLWRRRLSPSGGGREHLWHMTRDRHYRPRFLRVFDSSSFSPSSDWCLVQCLWHDLLQGWDGEGAGEAGGGERVLKHKYWVWW